MTSEISRLHSILNSKAVLPDSSFRRNVVIYELVCYVNCLIGCVLSERVDVLPIFAQRCREFMEAHPSVDHDPYYSVVRSYLTELDRTFNLEKEGDDA